MKKISTLLLTLTAVALCSGCAGLTSFERELAKDPTTVSIHVTTLWATMDFTRAPTMSTTNAVSVK